jgi:hypothetical protein
MHVAKVYSQLKWVQKTGEKHLRFFGENSMGQNLDVGKNVPEQ